MALMTEKDTRPFRMEIEKVAKRASDALEDLAMRAEQEMDALIERIRELEAENKELRERVGEEAES